MDTGNDINIVEFCGLPFRWYEGMASPRRSTELLVNEVIKELELNELDKEPTQIVDLCTGVGNIACALAKTLFNAHIIGIDIDEKACMVAKSNADRLGFGDRITIIQHDIRDGILGGILPEFDLVIANPPYSTTSKLNSLNGRDKILHREGRLAFDGGIDGLDVLRCVIEWAEYLLADYGFLAFEVNNAASSKIEEELKHAKNLSSYKRIAIELDKLALIYIKGQLERHEI